MSTVCGRTTNQTAATRTAAATGARRERAGTLARQECGDAVDDLRLLVPRPVTRIGDDVDLGRAAQCAGVCVREPRLEVRVLLAPDHERGGGDLGQVAAHVRQLVLRCRAVEAQDRALRAVVEVLPDAVD